MPDKTYGINPVLLDSLKLEESLLAIANQLLPVSLDELIIDLTPDPNPC